jgi:hypothetical protein
VFGGFHHSCTCKFARSSLLSSQLLTDASQLTQHTGVRESNAKKRRDSSTANSASIPTLSNLNSFLNELCSIDFAILRVKSRKTLRISMSSMITKHRSLPIRRKYLITVSYRSFQDERTDRSVESTGKVNDCLSRPLTNGRILCSKSNARACWSSDLISIG